MSNAIAKPAWPQLQRGHPLAQGLVGAWPFYEGAGSVLHDLSGGNRDGAFVNGPPWTAGPFGNAVSFTAASSQEISVSVSPLTGTVGNLSLWGWGFRSAGTDLLMWGWGDTANARAQILVFSDGNIYWTVENATNTFPSCAAPSLGAWHFYCLVFTPSTITAYIDGVKQTLIAGGSIPASYVVTGTFRIGRETASSRFATGKFDGVGVSSRALNASEVAQLYYDPFAIYRPVSRWWEVPATTGAFTNRPGPRIGPALPFGLAIGGAYGASKLLKRNPVMLRRRLLRW